MEKTSLCCEMRDYRIPEVLCCKDGGCPDCTPRPPIPGLGLESAIQSAAGVMAMVGPWKNVLSSGGTAQGPPSGDGDGSASRSPDAAVQALPQQLRAGPEAPGNIWKHPEASVL